MGYDYNLHANEPFLACLSPSDAAFGGASAIQATKKPKGLPLAVNFKAQAASAAIRFFPLTDTHLNPQEVQNPVAVAAAPK